MAQIKVSDLTGLATLSNTDLVLITEDLGGSLYDSKKMLVSDFRSELGISGTLNYLPKFNGIGYSDSQIFDNGTNISINGAFLGYSKLTIYNEDDTGTTAGLVFNTAAGNFYSQILSVSTTEGRFAFNAAFNNLETFAVKGVSGSNIFKFQDSSSQDKLVLTSTGHILINGSSDFANIAMKAGVSEYAIIITNNATSENLISVNELGYSGFGTAGSSGNRLTVKGQGSTSATNSLIVENSSSLVNFQVKDDGEVLVNAIRVGTGSGNINTNSVLGLGSLNSNTTGFQNTAVGSLSMANNTTGNANTSVGSGAFSLNTTGSANTAVGYGSLPSNTTGNDNVSIGYLSLQSNTSGGGNVAVGASCLISLTSGTYNVGISSIGCLVSETTGNYNTAIGNYTLSKQVGLDFNVAVGHAALYENLSGSSNTGVGSDALRNTLTSNNTAIGAQAGMSNISGANNTFLGAFADTTSNTLSNVTCVGYNAKATLSDSVILGNLSANVGIGTSSPTSKVHVIGDIKLGASGNGILITEGANATMGTATLSGGVVTVNTTKVTANSRIFLTINGGTITNVGAVYVSSRVASTSFTISSLNILDSSDVSWVILEPA